MNHFCQRGYTVTCRACSFARLDIGSCDTSEVASLENRLAFIASRLMNNMVIYHYLCFAVGAQVHLLDARKEG